MSDEYEAQKCIKLAKDAIKNEDYEKAKKFTEKSVRIFRTQEANDLLKFLDTKLSSRTRKNSKETTNNIPQQSYTQEQVEICEQILKKSNYYDILSLKKDASEEEVKKQYRKLALKLHPDKNNAPQANEAFKKVTKAYACLSDKNKRRFYYENGSETRVQQGSSDGNGNTYYTEEEFDAEDIFNMFFFGVPLDRNRNRRMARRSRPEHFMFHQNRQDTPISKYASIMQTVIPLAIFILFFSSYLSSLGSYFFPPSFSLDRSQSFPIQRMTKTRIPYYVSTDFDISPDNVNTVEQDVHKKYLEEVSKLCESQRSTQNYYKSLSTSIFNSKAERQYYRAKADSINLDACQEYSRFTSR